MAQDPAASADDWETIKARFDALVDLPPTERRPLLDQLPPHIATEVTSLLDAADRVGSRFSMGHHHIGMPAALTPYPPDSTIGAWRLVRVLGQGGMGTVYEVSRDDDQFRQRGALKMASRSVPGDPQGERFRHERQMLAELQHRHIAALLDGGVTPEGLTYFVMEYVAGDTIDHWCTAQQSSQADRLALIGQVCEAVHHAHTHLIVHRDLKPGNILVTTDGTVKLLDFGIAKWLDPELADDWKATRTGLTPMTVAYASPEQLRGGAVSTASDIYSLGIILYELLTGHHPFSETAPAMALQQREDGPPASRTTGAPLPADLEAIVRMALRAEPEARYRSVQQLAEDLDRFRRGEPVLAQVDSLGYRWRRFFGRHRAAVLTSAAALLLLCGTTAVAWDRATVARRERDAAIREQQRTAMVTAFFQDLLVSASPTALGREARVVEAIDRAIPALDTAFASALDIRAAVKNTLGSTLQNMFLHERARPLLQDALRLRETIDQGQPSRERADALYNLAGVEDNLGYPEAAESLYRASLTMYGQIGADSSEIYRGMNNLAGALISLGKLDEAADLYGRIHHWYASRPPVDSTFLAVVDINLGTTLATLGRYAEAETPLRGAATYFRGPTHTDTFRLASALQPLAGTLLFLERYADAEATAREAWILAQRTMGERNAFTVAALRMLVNIEADGGSCAEAIRHAEQILAMEGPNLPVSDPSIGTAHLFAAVCRSRLGDHRRALQDASRGLRLREEYFPTGHWAVAQARSMAGEVIGRSAPARADEAEALLRDGYQGMREALDSNHVRVRQGRARLTEFLSARGTPHHP